MQPGYFVRGRCQYLQLARRCRCCKSHQRFIDDKNAEFPVVYISFPSAKDPDYQNRHPGTSTIEIVAPAPYQWFEKWRDETWGKRGADYDAFKDQLGDRYDWDAPHGAFNEAYFWLGVSAQITAT